MRSTISSRWYPWLRAMSRSSSLRVNSALLGGAHHSNASTACEVEKAFVPEAVEARITVLLLTGCRGSTTGPGGLATLSLVSGEGTLTLRRGEHSLRRRGSRVVRLESGDGGSM
jgi:hypothetical protein